MNFIEKIHFYPPVDIATQRLLFQKSVELVEIEVFSYCNRRCWFCPNSYIDRHTSNTYMDENLYVSILKQLATIGYSRMVSYSRYNEPLSDRIILKRLQQARFHLPNVFLHLNTNGDYLTRSYLDELYRAGLNSLNIQIYLGNNDTYNHENMRGRMQALISNIGVESHQVIDKPMEWLESKLAFEDMQIRIYARNFAVNGCSRGGTVPVKSEYIRNSPCLAPFRHFIIDYNGKVMPCCNLRSDIPEHSGAAVADLSIHPDIYAAYGGSSLSAWRRHLIGFGDKMGPCRSCSFDLINYEEHRKTFVQYSNLLHTEGNQLSIVNSTECHAANGILHREPLRMRLINANFPVSHAAVSAKGLVLVRQNGFRRQPRLIENAAHWCDIRNIPFSIIDHDHFYSGNWGMPEDNIGVFYFPIAERYDPIEKIPRKFPVIIDFDANGSSNIHQLDLRGLKYAVRNAFGMKINANCEPEFQVPYVNRPMKKSEEVIRDVVIFDVKPFHTMPAQSAVLALITEISAEYERICSIAGLQVYLYFSSFMDPNIYMEAIDVFVKNAAIYKESTNHLRRISWAILPPAVVLSDYHKIMQRCRLFVTEHGDIADIDLIQIGCLGIPILLYKRRPFFGSAGISLQTLAGAEAIEPRIRGMLEDAERERVREEWGLDGIFSRDHVTPWNPEILDNLFLKSWDLLWQWAIDGVVDERVNAAMQTDIPWKWGLENTETPEDR